MFVLMLRRLPRSTRSTHSFPTRRSSGLLGDIGFIVSAILGAVFFTILMLTGNTMAQAVRERTPELAVLKCLGFTDRTVLALVLAEALLLCFLGGLAGMALASFATAALPRSEEHTSELQSLMRISYAVFCLKKKKTQHNNLLAD